MGGPVGDGAGGRASSPTAAPAGPADLGRVVSEAVFALAAAMGTSVSEVDHVELHRDGAYWRLEMRAWWLQHGRTTLTRVVRRSSPPASP